MKGQSYLPSKQGETASPLKRTPQQYGVLFGLKVPRQGWRAKQKVITCRILAIKPDSKQKIQGIETVMLDDCRCSTVKQVSPEFRHGEPATQMEDSERD